MYFAVSISEYERSFLAGFLEGEATLSVHELNGGQSLSCALYLKQRDDEQDTLEWLLSLTGIGRLRRVPARATSKPQISWLVDSQGDCRELVGMIQACGFHGRRAAELRLWREAVRVWTASDGSARCTRLRALKAELAIARRFGAGERVATPFQSRKQLLGYISGFVCAEGCFGMSGGRPRFSIHLRQDDEPLLRLLANETGLGNVTSHLPAPPLNPSSTWTVSGRAQLAELRDLLWDAGLAGRKLRELEIWATAVDELGRAARLHVHPRRELLQRARERLAAARAYQPAERADLLELPRRDLRSESLAALRTWAHEQAGALGCTNYMRWRRDQPDAPHRNTIVRQFGTWHRALAVAGLGDRAARAPRAAGGQERRRRARDAQRARVVAAVRRFEREHGRLPRALEFFRWRLQSSIDAPSQGTVYRLFPGGWAEVLRRAAQVAGATV
jgi:hypothetical protein